MMLSGFTYVHNAFEGGYPIVEVIRSLQPFCDEVVVVDAESDDGTRELLDFMASRNAGVRVLEGSWGDRAGETLAGLHAMNSLCKGDVVVHAEGDEVWDGLLLAEVVRQVKRGQRDLSVHRLQVSQNFQRCRWWPFPVHRVFPRGTVAKQGHTTDRERESLLLGPEHGFLWDCTNCFRDCFRGRVENQARLWHGGKPNLRVVPTHYGEVMEVEDLDEFLAMDHWTWMRSPFALPPLLRRLVGETRYEARL